MMRVTVIPSDSVVIVDGVAVVFGVEGGEPFPETDAVVHAIQSYDDGHATMERTIGERLWYDGDDAADLVAPFVAAHAAELARIAAEQVEVEE